MLTIAIPMAGTGKRFVEAGYALPKPLLPLRGKCLVQWAVGSTSLLNGQYHYLPSEAVAKHPLLNGMLPPGCWHVVMEKTPGPLQTVLQARQCLENEKELLIMDCDSMIDAQELLEAVEIFRDSQATGGVTLRQTTDPNCSYAMVDSEWWVGETREKEVFSPWSTTGPYWFASGKAFLAAAEKALRASHVSISPIYNYLEKGTKVKGIPVSSFKHLGTPEEYEAMNGLCTAPQSADA